MSARAGRGEALSGLWAAIDELRALARQALALGNITLFGTRNTQIGLASTSYMFARTVNAASALVDSGIPAAAVMPPGHTIECRSQRSYRDITTTASGGSGGRTVLKNVGGVLSSAGHVDDANVGDASLNGAGVAVVILINGNIGGQFTPPGGYAGTIDWYAQFNFLVN